MSTYPDGPDRPTTAHGGTSTTRVPPATPRYDDEPDRGPDMGVVTPYGRPGVYIYPFWQRSEFWAMALTAIFVGIAAAVEDGFPAEAAWTLITVLAASYILSRGFAKREPRDDDNDGPWTPGRGDRPPASGRFTRGVR